jgi:hypothetical protein
MPDPLRLYRFADAPPALQDLSDCGGDEVLVCVVPQAWLDEACLHRLPHALWLLLAAETTEGRFDLQLAWDHVQRVVLDDGSCVVIVSRS